MIIFPIVFNFLFLWDSKHMNGNTSDWFTLYGGILSGMIGGTLTFLGVKITLKHKDKRNEEEKKPKLDILDQHFLLNAGLSYDHRKNIEIKVQNLGGSIAKNIEAKLKFKDFDKLINEAENRANKGIKDNLYINSFIDPRNEVKRASLSVELDIDHKVQDFIFGNIGEVYFRLIGNCIPIELDFRSYAGFEVPSDVHGWITYFWGSTNWDKRGEFFQEGVFDMILELKYHSIDNKEFIQKFNLSFKDQGLSEIENGFSVEVLTLRSTEIPI